MGYTKVNKNVKEFLSHALLDMITNKVSLSLPRKYKVLIEDNIKVNGYFDEPKTFVVAMSKPVNKWLPIFVHEYCHYRQSIEKEPCYVNFDKVDGIDEYDPWLAGKAELTKEQLLACTRACQELELDCEKRAVEIMKKFNLPIDIDYYIRRGNAYVLFYNYVMKHRTWTKNISPYDPPEVLLVTPDIWLKSYKTMTPAFEDAITTYCFGGKI